MGYDETVSGRVLGFADGPNPYAYVHDNPWTNFDPLGLETESDYGRDVAKANSDYNSGHRDILKQLGKIALSDDSNAIAERAKLAADDDKLAETRDQKVADAAQGLGNLVETAKYARAHNIPVNEDTLDDNPNYSTSMGSTTVTTIADDLIGSGGSNWIPGRGPPTRDELAYGVIRGAMTKADAQAASIEVVKMGALYFGGVIAEETIAAFRTYANGRRVVEDAEDIIQFHHAYPKYLGGDIDQILEPLPKAMHDAYHSGLDKILPRQATTAFYDGLAPAAREQMQQDLAAYTKAFDAQNNTHLYDAMVREGFPKQP